MNETEIKIDADDSKSKTVEDISNSNKSIQTKLDLDSKQPLLKIPRFYKFEYNTRKLNHWFLVLITISLSVFSSLFTISIFKPKFNANFWKLNISFETWPALIFLGILLVLIFTLCIINTIGYYSLKKEFKQQSKNFSSEATNFVSNQFIKIHCRRNTWNWFIFGLYFAICYSILFVFLYVLYINSKSFPLDKSVNTSLRFLIVSAEHKKINSFWQTIVIGLGVGAGAIFILQMLSLIVFKLRINAFVQYYGHKKNVVDENLLETKLKKVKRRNLIIFLITILLFVVLGIIIINLIKRIIGGPNFKSLIFGKK